MEVVLESLAAGLFRHGREVVVSSLVRDSVDISNIVEFEREIGTAKVQSNVSS